MPTRIALIADDFPAVSETFVADHAVGLARRGFDVVVLCARSADALLAPVQSRAGGRLRVVPLERVRRSLAVRARAFADLAAAARRCPQALGSALARSLLARVPGLAYALRAERPDVVHAHFASNGVAAALAAPRGTPVVVDLHGWDFTALPRIVGWGLLRTALRDAALVAHSTFALERIRHGLGRSPRLVPLGVDLRSFDGAPRSETWPRPLRLLCVGRLVPQKGHDVALSAVAQLMRAAEPLDVTLRIVGDGPRREALTALASELGVGGAVRFTGAAPPEVVAAEMAAADVLVVPSVVGADGWEEAFGRVALEGLAAGLAVVVTRTGGLPDTVGDAGRVVPPGDPDALARTVRALAAGRGPAAHAAAARARAASFSLERMWDAYEHVAREATANGPQAVAG